LGAARRRTPEPSPTIYKVQEGLAMKRLLVLLAVLVPLSLFMVGCGQGGGSGGSPEIKKYPSDAKFDPEKKKAMLSKMNK
jgi:hypothetical protein